MARETARRHGTGLHLQVPQAIVVRRVDTGEAHRLIEVLSPEHGLLTALARGARASRRRFAGTLESFATLSLQLQRRSGGMTYAVQEAQPLALRLGLRRDYDTLVRASCLCRCARALAAPQAAAPQLFALLGAALDRCAAGEMTAAAATYPQLLQAAGLLPAPHCARCGAAQVPLGLSLHDGSLWCRGCAPALQTLAPSILQILHGEGSAPADESLARAVEATVLTMIGIQLGRRPPRPAYGEPLANLPPCAYPQ